MAASTIVSSPTFENSRKISCSFPIYSTAEFWGKERLWPQCAASVYWAPPRCILKLPLLQPHCPDNASPHGLLLSVCVCVCVCMRMLSHLVMSDFLQLHGLLPARLLCPWDSPGKNTAVGSHSLLQGIFLTQGWNPGLLHCRQILYCLSHQGCQ